MGTVDAAVDEVAAADQEVLDVGVDPDARSCHQLRPAALVRHFGPKLENADAVGVGDDEADREAGRIAENLQLHP